MKNESTDIKVARLEERISSINKGLELERKTFKEYRKKSDSWREENKVMIVRLEERIAAMQEALELARKQLVEYKAQSNEWRAENQDVKGGMATKPSLDALEQKMDIRLIAMGDKIDSKMKNVMYVVGTSVLVLGSLIIALFTFMRG